MMFILLIICFLVLKIYLVDDSCFFESPYARTLIDNINCISFNRLDESIVNSGIERNLCILHLEDG